MPATPKQPKELLLPQELETFYILPALRHILAQELHLLGKKQKDIAEIFGITSATISQYKSNKRGSQITFPPDIKVEICKTASKIHDRYTYIKEIQHLLHLLKTTNILCQIHHKLNNLPINCHPKNIGCGITIPKLAPKTPILKLHP